MIVYAYLFLIFAVIGGGERTFFRGDRYGLSDYYNTGLKTPAGVGVLKDFSNANILSHEPFIINLEFPKLGKSGDSRKSGYGVKRSRRQRKKNRRRRRFKQIVLPNGDLLERTKRFQILQRQPSYDFRAPVLLVPEDSRRGKNLLKDLDNTTPLDKSNYGRLMKFENEETTPKSISDPQKNILQQIISPKLMEDNSVEETTDANEHKQWEDIKSKWISLFSKDKDKTDNETDEEEEKLKLKSHKMWANCQLLKLLKAPQRNPFFYKLLPPNYPALIMNEEKQLQCNKVFDIIDLSKDKKMIADKIEQLEKILSSEFKNDVKVPETILDKVEDTSNMRRKRDVEVVEKSHESENTLHDESLQGKSEGDGRSDRSSRTKKRHRIRDRGKGMNKSKSKSKSRKQKDDQDAPQNTHHIEHKEKDHGTRKQKDDQDAPQNTHHIEHKEKDHGTRKQKDDRDAHHDTHHNEHKEKDHGSRNSRMAEPGQVATNEIPKISRLDEKELVIKTEDDTSEQKREKSEIKKDSILQDVFKPSELNKVIRQKELEANIFDKVVRTMKKYEENNPYDESFKPQKRESGNETEAIVADSGESILEVDDAVKKLAKIFKILGVRAGAKKCENCAPSEEVASGEDDDRKIKKLKMNRQNKKCTCGDDCPLCQDCLKCFKECKKNVAASKNMISSKPNNSQYSDEYSSELITENKPEGLKEEAKDVTERTPDETATDRSNSVRLERTNRSKLPASKDHVRLYYDNPQNKLLMWTKRGRGAMSLGPLTSDLQLYRDRARKILKSAEDILQRIKDTEEKLHASEQFGENDGENQPDKNKKEKVIDDIIKKVVNEDDVTKSILRIPWEAELNKTQDNLKELEMETVELEKENKENEESEYQTEDEKVAKPESDNQLKIEEKVELEKVVPEKESNVVKEKDESASTESKSIEADVESIEREDSFEKVADDKVQGIQADAGEAGEQRKSEEAEDEEYEDFPARVESVSNKAAFPDEVRDERLEKTEDRSEEEEDRGEDLKLEKTNAEEPKDVEYGTGESVASESAEEMIDDKVRASKEEDTEERENEEFEDDKVEKSMSYESDAQEVERSENYDYKPEEETEDNVEHSDKDKSVEYTGSTEQKNEGTFINTLQESYPWNEGSKNIFQDQIKPIEKDYIIKGVKKTQEEKEAILKALLNTDLGNKGLPEEEIEDLTEEPEIVEQTTVRAVEQKAGDAFKTLVDNLSNGHMDEKDFEELKNLDQTEIDHLVGEIQKKDKSPTKTTSCDKQIKLCQIACGCNGTNTTADVDKYDIIKGFLGWLKNVQMDQMVSISA